MEEKNLKNVMIGLLALVAILAGVLGYILVQKNKLVQDLNVEKGELTEQLVALQNDYESLTTDYESINDSLRISQEEVAQLIERVKKTEATNRAKMRQYEKELGTLRSIMRNYIVQIDSLNTLNKQLTAEAAAARKDAAESKKKSENLSKQVESLSGQVAAGAVIKSSGLRIEAYNGSGQTTDRSSRVTKLMATLSLVANDLAAHGPVRVYIVVKDPDGNVLKNGNSRSFTSGGASYVCSASREVDYEGNEVTLSIYVNDIPEYVKGIYTVQAFTSQSFLGSAELLLR